MTLDDWLESQRGGSVSHGFECIGRERMQQVWDAAIGSLRGEPVAWVEAEAVKPLAIPETYSWAKCVTMSNKESCTYNMPLYARPPAAQWVSVKERLPDEGQQVLWVGPSGYRRPHHIAMRSGYYTPSHRTFPVNEQGDALADEGIEPTHWMPLPAAPGGES